MTQSNELVDNFDWPEDFSLYEAYEDYFLIGTIYTDANRSGRDKDLTLKHFNTITAENIMKPEYMQRSPGNFSYENSNRMMQFAQENNLNVIGHTLVWHQQSGNWLGRNVSREEAIEQLRSHITNVVGQYKGQIMAWDVVNEAVNDGSPLSQDGDWTKSLRRTQWLTSIGPEYIALAFQFAHEADPDAILYYNDYNLNNKGKADVVHAMVKDLKEQGVPIHGIGMQGHYNTTTSIGSVEYSIRLFSELDVEVSITELDVTVNGANPMGLTKEEEIEQAVVYARLFQLFKQYSDTIERVTFWGYVDSKSWRKEQFPCLFNGDFTAKEAVYAVLNPEMYLKLNWEEKETVSKLVQAKYGTPTIDGEVDEIWKSTSEIQVNNQIMAWQGATGTVRLLWDENYLYALFEVKDRVLNRQSPNVYEHDSIEIFLDQNNDKTPYYGDDDGQYRVNFEGRESFGSVPTRDGFVSSAKIIDGGYRVELAIPFINTASAGRILGFDAQINDSNGQGVRQSIAKFNDLTDNSWSTTENWGAVELVK